MIPPIERIRVIAEKMLKGTASPEEKADFFQYVDANGEEAAKEALFSPEIYRQLPEQPAPPEVADSVLQSILSTASRQQAPVIAMPVSAPGKNRLRYGAVAACMALLAGFFIVRSQREKGQQSTVAVLWDSIANPQQVPRLVTLADRTTVWLNAKAVLYISKEYSTNRLVRLQGEGYFDVAQQAQHPFRVQTGAITTIVLGTTFNIECIDSAFQVSLVTGKVKVSNGAAGQEAASVILLPGETAFAKEATGKLSATTTSVKDIAAWTRGDLVLNQVSLQEALHKISSKYGITINAGQALLAGKEVSGIYPHTQTWEQVLAQVLFIYQLHYQKTKDGSIVITS